MKHATFKRVLITGWAIFFLYIAFTFVFPRQVLRYGMPMVFLGILLGLFTFVYALIWVYRDRRRRRNKE